MQSYRAYLFDLDGTLLRNDMQPFMSAYSQMLARRISAVMPLDLFQQHMDLAVDQMIRNTGPQTNQQVFMEAFFKGLDYKPEVILSVFDTFYAEDFRHLSQAGEFKADVQPLLKQLLESDARVVIATNPIFPRTAIDQRLEWAGVADLEFDLVTSYENSRATKYNIKYYEDICAEINLAPQECLMIGDQAWDLIAANIGCDTFLVPSPNTDVDGSGLQPTYQGSIADLAKGLSFG